MGITITVTGDSPQDVQAKLGALLFGMPDAHARFAPIHTGPAAEYAPAPSQPLPPGEGTPMIGDKPAAAAQTAEPEKPKRGRPKKDAEPTGPVWETRRYGGESDLEFSTERQACERLVELIHNAGSIQALDSLMTANADLVSNIGREWAEQIRDAEKNARAGLAPAAQPTQADAAPAYTDVNGEPLHTLTPDMPGAKNAIRAIATGAPPTLGFTVASALLQKHGLKKVSEMKDDDPRLAVIVREAAEILKLPVAESDAAEPDANALFT